MKISLINTFVFACALGAAGCKSQKPPEAPDGTSATTAGKDPSALLEKHPEKAPSRASINISDRIRQACGLTDTETHFDFDSAKVPAAADAVLSKLAECFATGPLKDEKMQLVGHADPRGDEEYNYVLSADRAENVKTFLVSKTLGQDRVLTSSRGESDATGTDDESWSRDRRVDVMIAEEGEE